jgi:mannosyltransferase
MFSRRGASVLVLAAVAVGAVAAAVSAAAIGRPSLWYDESATRIAVQLDPTDFSRMLHEVDLVHAAYYGLLRGWCHLVGTSLPALRLPSAVAVGTGAGLLVVLGTRLQSLRLGVSAGLVFAVLPVTVEMGGDARSRAVACSVVIATVLAFVTARSTTGRGRIAAWSAFGALGALAVVVNVHDALVLAALAVTLLIGVRRQTADRADLRAWAIASAATGAVALPFAWATATQVGQVAWIGPVRATEAAQLVAVTQWFPGAPAAALVGWCCVVVGLLPRRHDPAPWRATVLLLVPWAVVPTAVLLLSHVAGVPMYSPRYPSMSTPALALLIALGVLRATPPWRVSIAALLVATSAVSWCQQRFDPTRPDWRSAAQHIEHERTVHPGPAGIVYSQTLRRPEHIADDSPGSVEGLVDLTAGPREDDQTRWFFRERRTPASASVVDSTAGLQTVLYVGAPGAELDDLAEALSAQGFAAVGEHRFRGERHDRDHGSVVTFAR